MLQRGIIHKSKKFYVLNHVGAIFAINHLHIKITWKSIYEFTQEKSLTNVPCVTKHLLEGTSFKITDKRTLEKTLPNVYCVTKHLLDLTCFKLTAEGTLEKNLTDVLNVPNHSAGKETYMNI
jgi:hypothetical protein